MESASKVYSGIILPSAPSDSTLHLSDLQKAMLNVTPDCIKVVSTDGRLLAMNRAGCLALNVPEDSEFGMPWLPLLPEDARQAGELALSDAAAGKTARFPGKSFSADGFRYWDNLLTPLADSSGHVTSILCVSRDVTTQTQLEAALENAVTREKLLAQEMQHRIKNLFALASGLISISEKEAAGASDPGSALDILREKMSALSRASDAVFSERGADPDSAVDLRGFISSVLLPYGARCSLDGEPSLIFPRYTTTLALLLHELATNSVKHGALGVEQGKITVRWTSDNASLNLTWTESGGPRISAPPSLRCFGSEMVDRIVRASGGRLGQTWRPEGLVAELHLPNSLRENERAKEPSLTLRLEKGALSRKALP